MNLFTAAADRWPGIDTALLQAAYELVAGARSLSPELSAELLLTRACALGHSKALAELDGILREEVARAVRPLNAALVDDVTQLVRERLIIAKPEGRIGEFRAEGSLRGWLRAIAVRTALNAQRGVDVVADEEPNDLRLAGSDPELELFRARHRETFRAAFADAVAALTVRDRTVLRLHTLDGVTLARIGVMHGKDTSTVSRWLEQIRRTLREVTRARLATRLSLTSDELDSVLRSAELEVSVSLARLLAE